RALLPQPPGRRRGRHAGGQGDLGAPEEEGPHDLRALALLLHAQHDVDRGDGRRDRQAPRSPLRPARDQGRRGSPRALALPDDPHRGQEAGPARVRRGARQERHDPRPGARLPRRAPEDEACDLPRPAHGLRGPGRESRTARGPEGRMMKLIGMDVGSTTVKAVAVEWRAAAEGEASGYKVLWQDYQRHNTRQAEKVLEFLGRMEDEAQVVAARDRVFFTGSGAGLLGPLVGAKMIQEVVAVAACVERLHPDVRFVSEIGGEDMKTIFFTPTGTGRSKQVYMQSACSGGTGTFIEKTARKLQVASERLAGMPYAGMSLHKVSSKCGIFAETDANTLVKTGVPVEEIIASLFEAVVYQNLATLTKGNTPSPEVMLLGGPNLFFKGLQEAWRHHLGKLWEQRRLALPEGREPASLITVPAEALYYACLGCVEIGAGEADGVAVYEGRDRLRWWVEEGQQEEKAKAGGRALVACAEDLTSFVAEFDLKRSAAARAAAELAGPVLVGCDFGSTTAKAVVLSPARELLFTCYALSKGNPIEDAQSLFRQVREAGYGNVGGLALTGYGKDLLRDVVGADVAVVETVAHATGTLHFHPDADVICDVGGTDVKIM